MKSPTVQYKELLHKLGNQKIYDLLYCNICFIAVIWNQTGTISKCRCSISKKIKQTSCDFKPGWIRQIRYISSHQLFITPIIYFNYKTQETDIRRLKFGKKKLRGISGFNKKHGSEFPGVSFFGLYIS